MSAGLCDYWVSTVEYTKMLEEEIDRAFEVENLDVKKGKFMLNPAIQGTSSDYLFTYSPGIVTSTSGFCNTTPIKMENVTVDVNKKWASTITISTKPPVTIGQQMFMCKGPERQRVRVIEFPSCETKDWITRNLSYLIVAPIAGIQELAPIKVKISDYTWEETNAIVAKPYKAQNVEVPCQMQLDLI